MEKRIETEVVEDAASLFAQGFTCGQAVLAAFAQEGGLPQDVALRLGCAFGGGVARSGGTCGAVNGALMAIGLKFGQAAVQQTEAREKTYGATRSFLVEFRRSHGSDVCRELLGVDISTQEGRDTAMKNNLFKTRCPVYVRDAARIVSSLR
jgi:C_GCAxxG_C_C family probable redox protein